ncbi:hypothetical protein JCM8202_002673 [Rhodotorula sphaerocarpa]
MLADANRLAALPADADAQRPSGKPSKSEIPRTTDNKENAPTAPSADELASLTAKVRKLEQNKADLKRDRDQARSECNNLQSQLRHLTAKLGKTTALLEKHQSVLPSLQSKLEAMSASHTSSAARKDAELATLRGRLAELERRLESERVRTEAVEADRDAWQERAQRERSGREEAATAAGEVVARLRAEAHDAASSQETATYALQLAQIKLERQLADRQAQIESLAAYASTLEARLALADEDRARTDRDNRFVLVELWRAERDLAAHEGRDVEKEWRQRARADARDVDGLRELASAAETEAEVLAQWSRDVGAWEEGRARTWRSERSAAKKALQATEAELETALHTEIPRLEGLLAASESTLQSTRSALAAAEAHASSLEADLAELQQRLVDETGRLEREAEEQVRVAAETRKELERERAEKRRVVGILAQTRASEAGLKEEVESLNREVTSLTPLLAQNDALQEAVDHLARLNAASEVEAQQLVAQNAELVGHSNQGQKIRHVAMMREELTESRKKHLAAVSSLTAAQHKISNLEAELDTYRAVPSSGPGGGGIQTNSHAQASRARVSRPVMNDAYSSTAATPPNSNGPPAITVTSSAAPPDADAIVDDEPSLLPPQLAKSQPAQKVGNVRRAVAGAKSVGAPSAAAAAAGGAGERKAGPVAAAMRRQSMGVKMEGRMSVSELF